MDARKTYGLLVVFLVFVLVVFTAFSVGAVPFSLLSLLTGTASTLESTVFFDIRGPRVVLASFVGAALAVAGACLQGLFRNPLADPGLIGVSSGGALGAIFVIVFGSSLGMAAWFMPYALPIGAVIGAVSVTLLLYLINFSKVVLPAPFGPIIETRSPALKENSRSFTMYFEPIAKLTCFNR